MQMNSIDEKNKDFYLSPSIIAADLSMMGNVLVNLDKDLIDFLHIDVMDGNFVPNLTIGPGYVKNLKKHTDIPLDIHLMIDKPEKSLEEYINLNPRILTIHFESTLQPVRLLQKIRENNILAGLSINPATPVSSIYDILEFVDVALIMSVEPGFYGQKFIKSSLNRIKTLNEFITENMLNTKIEVDGGINKSNIHDIVKAGASIIVAGSAVFNNENPNTNAKSLYSQI